MSGSTFPFQFDSIPLKKIVHFQHGDLNYSSLVAGIEKLFNAALFA